MALAGFNNSFKLTIDSSKIDEDLTNFPVNITLSSGTGQTGFDATAIFDELVTISGNKNIAITDSNDNKLYTEIERWDWDNKEANLWVNVPTIASGTDTTLYLYYDATASGQDVRPIADVEDDFTGVDDDPPNPLIWTEIDSANFLSIQSNKLNYIAPAGVYTSSRIESTFYLGGDFDIQIDFDSITTTPTENLVIAPQFLIAAGSVWGSIIHGNQLTTGLAYVAYGSVTGWVPYNTADTSGKIRFTRSGTTIKGYIWSGSQWEWDGNTAGYTFAESHSDDVYVRIVFTRRPSGSNDCNIDNFTINSADYVTGWVGDTGETPAKQVWDSNFKGIWHMAQEPSNNDVLLRATEVGNIGDPAQAAITFGPFDCTDLTKTNGTLVIDLKCDDPSNISASPPTTIEITSTGGPDSEEWAHSFTSSELSKLSTTYKKFVFPLTDWVTTGGELDVSQIDYIRWWGYPDSGNLTLWWKNAYLIWPDGEEHIALDSTSNENHGVFQESMTDGDLVDGKVGKAIDFDGSDDAVGVVNDSSLNNISTITIESTFKAAGWGESNSGRIIAKATSVNENGWSVLLHSPAGEDRFLFIQAWNTDDGAWVTPNSSISLNNWYHGVIQYDRSYGTGDKPTIYLNGVSQIVNTLLTPVGSIESDAAQDVVIGSRAATDREFEGIIDEVRISDIYRSDAWIKATYYSNWDNLVTLESFGLITFTFSGPIPIPYSTVYGISHQLQLTTTLTGSASNYIYDASFYDASDDNQIGPTVSGTQSGQYVSATMSTPSANSYSWYVTATSSGQSDTSSTYDFSNRFMCSGYTQVAGTGVSGIPVRLYRRSTGVYIGGAISSGVSGTFDIPTDYNENHYAVALYPTSGTNALIADWLKPDN